MLTYTVLTSPEIATSKLFNQEVLRHQEFQEKLCLLVVDELHLVEDWKSFRPDYMEISALRARLPADLPFLGASATLSDTILQEIQVSCGFRSDRLSIIKTSLDRPEIYIQVAPIQGAAKDMKDLHHLLPANATKATDIPKTIIFMESINSIRSTCKLMRGWMRSLKYPEGCHDWILTFFSEMSDYDKENIASRFLRRSSECDSPRILICTDAYGLGLDNPDVEVVVQFKIPRCMSVLEQRKGRAMRSGEGQARYLFLYQPSMILEHENPETDQCDPLEIGGSSQAIVSQSSNDKQATRLEPGLETILIAAKEGKCIRRTILQHFNAIDLESKYVNPSPCCSSCDPEFAVVLKTHESVNQEAWCNALKRPWFERNLREWRDRQAMSLAGELHPVFQSHERLILPEKTITKLIRLGDVVTDLAALRSIGGNGWGGRSKYATGVMAILAQGQGFDPVGKEVRLAAKLETSRRFSEAQSRKGSRESALTERIKARQEWLANVSAQKPTIMAMTKRKMPLQTPLKPSKRTQSALVPAAGLPTPPSTMENKENQMPMSQMSQMSQTSCTEYLTDPLTEPSTQQFESPIRKVVKSSKRRTSSTQPPDTDRTLRPSSSRQNRQLPKRFCY